MADIAQQTYVLRIKHGYTHDEMRYVNLNSRNVLARIEAIKSDLELEYNSLNKYVHRYLLECGENNIEFRVKNVAAQSTNNEVYKHTNHMILDHITGLISNNDNIKVQDYEYDCDRVTVGNGYLEKTLCLQNNDDVIARFVSTLILVQELCNMATRTFLNPNMSAITNKRTVRCTLNNKNSTGPIGYNFGLKKDPNYKPMIPIHLYKGIMDHMIGIQNAMFKIAVPVMSIRKTTSQGTETVPIISAGIYSIWDINEWFIKFCIELANNDILAQTKDGVSYTLFVDEVSVEYNSEEFLAAPNRQPLEYVTELLVHVFTLLTTVYIDACSNNTEITKMMQNDNHIYAFTGVTDMQEVLV